MSRGGQPIKVLFVIGSLGLGGTEGQVLELLSRLDRRRFQPALCVLFETGPLLADVEAGGIERLLLRIQKGPHVLRTAWTVAKAALRLRRFLREGEFAVVHGFLFYGYIFSTFCARWAGTPVILSSRRSLGMFKERQDARLLERLANRWTHLVIANSEAVRADAIRREGLDPEKVVVVLNGVDLPRFSPERDPAESRRALGLPPEGPVVGMLANMIYYKAHEVLLQAARRVREAVPGVRFLLVGDGPLRPAIERQIAAWDLGRNVLLLGQRRDVPEILAALDLAVLCSREEGLPNALLEAMAAGRPVVATAVGGVPEVVVPGETGLLVPPDDPEALAGALVALLGDPSRAREMGRAGRDRAAKHFSAEGFARRMEAIYLAQCAARGVG